MPEVKIIITKFVREDFPGFVECVLVDAHGKEWFFQEKVPVVTTQSVDTHTSFPLEGYIRCQIVQKQDGVITISTELPDHVESIDEFSQFDVLPDMVRA